MFFILKSKVHYKQEEGSLPRLRLRLFILGQFNLKKCCKEEEKKKNREKIDFTKFLFSHIFSKIYYQDHILQSQLYKYISNPFFQLQPFILLYFTTETELPFTGTIVLYTDLLHDTLINQAYILFFYRRVHFHLTIEISEFSKVEMHFRVV